MYAGKCCITGIILFSGSLYLMSAFNATNIVGIRGIGIVTPSVAYSSLPRWNFEESQYLTTNACYSFFLKLHHTTVLSVEKFTC